jgi:hypothetical protein
LGLVRGGGFTCTATNQTPTGNGLTIPFRCLIDG